MTAKQVRSRGFPKYSSAVCASDVRKSAWMTEQKQEETMATKLVEKLRIIVFPILGVVLILCSGHVTRILPYLLEALWR